MTEAAIRYDPDTIAALLAILIAVVAILVVSYTWWR
jgi:hypothetical protein